MSGASGRPIRVLQVVQRFYPELGGLETHVAEVTRRINEFPDVDVTVLTTDRSGELPQEDRVNGVRVLRCRSRPRHGEAYFAPGLAKVITGGDWDLVHVQGSQTTVPTIAMAAARRAGIPYVVTFHSGGHSSRLHAPVSWIQNVLNRPLLARAARLVAVSRFERKRFQRITRLPADRFAVIQNGGALPSSASDVRPRSGSIVTSGRLERYKGHHRVIAALPLIRRSIPDATLTVLGSGPYEQELRGLAAARGVADAVSFVHLLPAQRDEMARLLKSSAVMAALSDYEAHPVAVMEAVAIGLPVVGADVAGIGDLVEDGWVIGIDPEADDAMVARALVDQLQQTSDDAHRPPDFPLPTWEDSAERLAALYREVCLTKNRSRRLRVVQVITTLTTGGAERQLESVVAHSRHQHRVIALYAGGAVEESLRSRGAKVEVLGSRKLRHVLTLPLLIARLSVLRPDVVQVHLLSGQLWGLPAARLARLRVVSTEHSLMDHSIENRPLTPRLRLLYLALNRLAIRTIAVSSATRSRLIAWGVPRSRISVVDNGIEFDRLAYSPTARAAIRAEFEVGPRVQLIGAVGRLETVKRFPQLISALAPTLGRGHRELMLVGDGPLREELIELAGRLGVRDAVHLTGPRLDVPDLLSAMDALVSLSRDETFGMAVVEALGAGLPVVHAEVPALADLGSTLPTAFPLPAVDGKSEAEALRGEIERALDLASKGRSSVAEELRSAYDIRATVARLDALLEELVTRRPRGA